MELQGDQVLVAARGEGIASVQLQLFNLAGKSLIDQSRKGSWLTLPAVNEAGRLLPNGVYLYAVTVKGFDGAIVSEVKKLIILR